MVIMKVMIMKKKKRKKNFKNDIYAFEDNKLNFDGGKILKSFLYRFWNKKSNSKK